MAADTSYGRCSTGLGDRCKGLRRFSLIHRQCLGIVRPITRQAYRRGPAMPETVNTCCVKPNWPAEVRLLSRLSWLALIAFVSTCAGTRLFHVDHGLTVAMTVFATLPAVAALSLSIRAWMVAEQHTGASRKSSDAFWQDMRRRMIARLRGCRDLVCSTVSHPWRTLTGWVRRWEARILYGMSLIGTFLFWLHPWISQLGGSRAEVYADLTLALAGLLLAISWGVMLERSPIRLLVLLLIVGGATVAWAVFGISTSETLGGFMPWAPSYLTVGVAMAGACAVPLWSKLISRNRIPGL